MERSGYMSEFGASPEKGLVRSKWSSGVGASPQKGLVQSKRSAANHINGAGGIGL